MIAPRRCRSTGQTHTIRSAPVEINCTLRHLGIPTMQHNLHAAIVAGLVLVSPLAQADEWKHEIAPYLFAAGMDGTVGVGPVEADVSQSFSDIVSNLEMGFMGAYRATKDQYSITFDTIYMGLGATKKGPGGLLKADVDADQLALEGDFGYAITDAVTLFGGLRYNDI